MNVYRCQVNLASQKYIYHNNVNAERALLVEVKGSSLLLLIIGIVAVIVALQTTVIFVVAIFIACKYRRTKRRARANNLEEVTTDEAFKLQENELYEVVDLGIPTNKAAHGHRNERKTQHKKNNTYIK